MGCIVRTYFLGILIFRCFCQILLHTMAFLKENGIFSLKDGSSQHASAVMLLMVVSCRFTNRKPKEKSTPEVGV